MVDSAWVCEGGVRHAAVFFFSRLSVHLPENSLFLCVHVRVSDVNPSSSLSVEQSVCPVACPLKHTCIHQSCLNYAANNTHASLLISINTHSKQCSHGGRPRSLWVLVESPLPLWWLLPDPTSSGLPSRVSSVSASIASPSPTMRPGTSDRTESPVSSWPPEFSPPRLVVRVRNSVRVHQVGPLTHTDCPHYVLITCLACFACD
mmetsp:Transcript_39703/g.99379  ORF Transcript_39703/g.99379 Transcript_39703/m.99379 type:complete len:204 (+) Transcript_39703:647-1258(+)